MNNEHRLDILRSHVAQLGEHFDTVQILVSRHSPSEDGGSVSFHVGTGNPLARYGHAKAWVLQQETAMANTKVEE